MTHIAVDPHGEAVKRFFLSLPADPQGTMRQSHGCGRGNRQLKSG
jgi:hypothetical protein